MTRREVVRLVLEGKTPPYVPWTCGFTREAAEKLQAHFGDGWWGRTGTHFLAMPVGSMEPLEGDRVRDHFGVVWDRSVDKDIGVVEGQVLPEPTLDDFAFPDPFAPTHFPDIEGALREADDRFRVFNIGFSLFERAWTLRGMEALMMDFLEHPDFVRELLRRIADWNITLVREAVKHDIDAVYFGDDWGSQKGVLMGPGLWREFVLPELARMYAAVHDGGKYVVIHSCGDVDELFDDLVGIGLNLFNPFQPEVMDVDALLPAYRGRLALHGGLSTQQALPYGSADDVRAETEHLLSLGAEGGYVFAPAHAVEGDVPLENMLAFLETVQAQPGAPGGMAG